MSGLPALAVVFCAVVLTAGILVVMMSAHRPQEGWWAMLRGIFTDEAASSEFASSDSTSARSGAAGRQAGRARREPREEWDDDEATLADLLADAESGPGYLTVPQRYEDRFDARMEDFVARQRQKARDHDRQREDQPTPAPTGAPIENAMERSPR